MHLQFNEWVFDADFSVARGGDVPPIRFTRQEQAVLAALVRRPGTLVSRAQLLESLDPDCEGAGERSVDFLVNRLRRKLRDDARKPRFIATRYGEGYVWLVKGRRVDQSFILVRVESVYGLTRLSNAEVGTAAVRALATELGERLHWRCVMPPSLGLTHPTVSGECDPRLRMDISVFDDATHLHIAAGIRDGRSGDTLTSLSRHFRLERTIEVIELAEALVTRIWSFLIHQEQVPEGPTEQPLLLQAHEAGLLLTQSPQYWLEIEPRILKSRQADPQDPRLAILWAATRYARLLRGFGEDGAETTRLFAEYEQSVESEVLSAVPALGESPAYQLTAAMLLLTLSRDHGRVVEELIEGALWNGSSFASVFSVRARLDLCRGDLAQAIAYLDRAIEMALSGSEFHVYLLVLKIKALIAGGRRREAELVLKILVGIKPQAAMDIGLQAADPEGELDPRVLQMLQKFGSRRVRQLLRHYFHLVVKPMRVREHRVQLMLGAVVQARRVFGSGVVADEILTELPELAEEVQASARRA